MGTIASPLAHEIHIIKLLRVHPLLQHYIVRAGSEMFRYLEII